jgi:hypothetical protein
MANAFSAILAVATDAAQIVSQEPTGFIDAIDFRPDLVGATLNTTVNIGVVSVPTKNAWTPSIKTSVVDSTETNVALTLSQAFEYQFHVTGEQLQGFMLGNFTADKYVKTKIAQGMRQCRNDIETYLAVLAKQGASRAAGIAGTTPFASNMDVTATIRRFLEENGAPLNSGDVSLVINPAAGENARKLLGTVTSAGGSLAADMQRAGMMPSHNGLQLRVSPQIVTHTKGTGAAYTSTGALNATDLTLAAGSGTIVLGDALAFAGDSNVYIAGAPAAATGLISKLINRPGIRVAQAGAALTIGNNYAPNIALHRGAIAAVVRPPAQVNPGAFQGVPLPFLADVIVDPVTGLPYGIYIQAGDGLVLVSIRAVYGAIPVNTEHIITLMG